MPSTHQCRHLTAFQPLNHRHLQFLTLSLPHQLPFSSLPAPRPTMPLPALPPCTHRSDTLKNCLPYLQAPTLNNTSTPTLLPTATRIHTLHPSMVIHHIPATILTPAMSRTCLQSTLFQILASTTLPTRNTSLEYLEYLPNSTICHHPPRHTLY